ncbi:alpha/beta hydrolase family protein [Chitinophaga solisilvae]|uniref:alpha/beta hydrolase family protein n=1 Tax=Chitinophaga solisilvae TaxID=1233460 RepID=UPI00136E59CA|nr:prolyl oligopeptidase family serine peptidase [Chitinophaga solisilvae]
MRSLFLFLILLCSFLANGQKKVIDICQPWGGVGSAAISADGLYACYIIGNKPQVGDYALEIVKTDLSKRMLLHDAVVFMFSRSGKELLFKNKGDSLGILNLSSSEIKYIPDVQEFYLPQNSEGNIFSYLLKSGKFIVYRGNQKEELSFPHVNTYYLNETGTILVLNQNSRLEEGQKELVWVNVKSGEKHTIWSGKQLGNAIFNKSGDKLIFFTYKNAVDREVNVSNGSKTVNLSIKLPTGYTIDAGGDIFVNEKTDYLFFKVIRIAAEYKAPEMNSVNVWSYKDIRLQPQQVSELPANSTGDVKTEEEPLLASMSLVSGEVNVITKAHESLESVSSNGDFLILRELWGYHNEANWNKDARASVTLYSVRDQSRKLLNNGIPSSVAESYVITPDSKFVIYFDATKQSYFSYEISTGKLRDITEGTNAVWTVDFTSDQPNGDQFPMRVAGFLPGDKGIFIYGRYDIFLADPYANKKTISITNNYGYKNGMVFRFAQGRKFGTGLSDKKMLLSAFNIHNKNDGFAMVEIEKQQDPKIILQEPYFICGDLGLEGYTPYVFQKAKDKNIYIVQKQSVSEAPNYFVTEDFIKFRQLSFEYPERSYKWMRAELIHWKNIDGKELQGILYKPDDFDSTKPYPIIFTYYVRNSNALHYYEAPGLSGGFNLPYMVTNGYLVFIPDIYYKIGEPGRSAYNSIVSAANYLGRFSWIDKKKMGLYGHSFGGFETNYVIAHTNIFAAAVSSSGMSNFISAYGSIIGNGKTRQGQYELGKDRIGGTPWNEVDKYIDNSPVFRANNIETPLLMMGNKDDDDVPFSQGVELFTALRRLGKKVWMMQYDNEGHIIAGCDNAPKDWTLRVRSFFDFYLKDKPARKWMTQGVPAVKKAFFSGMEIDSSHVTP